MLFSVLPCLASAQELGLKLQRELMPHEEADENAVVFVDADRIRGHQEVEFEAFGDVRLRRLGEAVFADYLRFDVVRQEVTASGDIRFERAGAVVNARIARLVYGCDNPKAGAVATLYEIPTDTRLNHRMEVVGGVRADECGELLTRFFAQLRDKRRGDREAEGV